MSLALDFWIPNPKIKYVMFLTNKKKKMTNFKDRLFFIIWLYSLEPKQINIWHTNLPKKDFDRSSLKEMSLINHLTTFTNYTLRFLNWSKVRYLKFVLNLNIRNENQRYNRFFFQERLLNYSQLPVIIYYNT